MADEETEKAEGDLDTGNLEGQAILTERAAPDKPEVEEGQVAGLAQGSGVRVVRKGQEATAGEQAQGARDQGVGLLLRLPDSNTGLEEAGAGVKAGQAVAGTGDEPEELRCAVDEVEDLGQQQQDQGLGEVAEDANSGEYHARKVTVCVTNEDAGRIPVVGQ